MVYLILRLCRVFKNGWRSSLAWVAGMPGPWKEGKVKDLEVTNQTVIPPASTTLGRTVCHAAIAA